MNYKCKFKEICTSDDICELENPESCSLYAEYKKNHPVDIEKEKVIKNDDAQKEGITKQLNFVKEQISHIPAMETNPQRVLKGSYFKDFIHRSKYAIQLIFQEKEIITFALLQWVVIGLAYYLWVQILGWIPDDVWKNDDKLANLLLNIVFIAWAFGCVGLAAFPISILTGCMGVSHFLRQQGQPSTIAGCFKIILPKIRALWIYHWIDGWITVSAILDRLPKKGGNRRSVLDEILYFAWKVGTVGILPSILNGRDLIPAGKESVQFVFKHPKETILLRGGYSLFCWIFGITTYIGAILFFISQDHLFTGKAFIYVFYSWMGIPILLGAGIIILFLRPIYIIASCKLYSDYIKTEQTALSISPITTKAITAIVAFVVLVIIIATVFLYREPLGLNKILGVVH